MKTKSHQPQRKGRRSTRAKHAPETPGLLILTIGHSTRPIGDFIRLLQAHGVTKLIDIRTVPRSKHNPQFGREQLPESLGAAGIAYEHEAALGGLRRTSAESPNQGWRNLSFRGYADHMQTPEFQEAVGRLITRAKRGERLALMCAEAVPWRCHRSLVADALLVRGVQCEDIQSPTRRMPHRLTRFAKVRGTQITYPSDDRTTPNAANDGAAQRDGDGADAPSRSRKRTASTDTARRSKRARPSQSATRATRDATSRARTTTKTKRAQTRAPRGAAPRRARAAAPSTSEAPSA